MYESFIISIFIGLMIFAIYLIVKLFKKDFEYLGGRTFGIMLIYITFWIIFFDGLNVYFLKTVDRDMFEFIFTILNIVFPLALLSKSKSIYVYCVANSMYKIKYRKEFYLFSKKYSLLSNEKRLRVDNAIEYDLRPNIKLFKLSNTVFYILSLSFILILYLYKYDHFKVWIFDSIIHNILGGN